MKPLIPPDIAITFSIPTDSLRRDLKGSGKITPKTLARKLGLASENTARHILAAGRNEDGDARPVLITQTAALPRLNVSHNFFRRRMQPRAAATGVVSGARAYWLDELRGCRDSVRAESLPIDLQRSLIDEMTRQIPRRDNAVIGYARLSDTVSNITRSTPYRRYAMGYLLGFFVRDEKSLDIGDGRITIRRHWPKNQKRRAIYLRIGPAKDGRAGNKPPPYFPAPKALDEKDGWTAEQWLAHWLRTRPDDDWTHNKLATALHSAVYPNISVRTLNKRVARIVSGDPRMIRDEKTGLITWRDNGPDISLESIL